MAGSPAELVALAAEHAQVRDGDDIEDPLGRLPTPTQPAPSAWTVWSAP